MSTEAGQWVASTDEESFPGDTAADTKEEAIVRLAALGIERLEAGDRVYVAQVQERMFFGFELFDPEGSMNEAASENVGAWVGDWPALTCDESKELMRRIEETTLNYLTEIGQWPPGWFQVGDIEAVTYQPGESPLDKKAKP